MRFSTFPLLSLLPLVAAHARIKSPIPLGAPPEDISGNDYNSPLAPDGSQFPCNNLHTNPSIDQTPTQSWRAGSLESFEILGHITAGEGALAAHSGGSCQASISFDNGRSFRVLHTFHGGCPRDVPFGSNLAGPNQTFAFSIPEETRAGPALFSWTWTAVSGNRDEFYMNCAAVSITGSGTSILDDGDYPDMYVGDMNIPGQIADGECRSTAGTALLYPDPGPAERVTVSEVAGIPFMAPSKGRCVAPGGKAPSSSVSASSSSSSSASTSVSAAGNASSVPATSAAPVPASSATPAVLLPTDAADSDPTASSSPGTPPVISASTYLPTEAVSTFISASESSTASFTPVPSYVPTEAVPSFVSAASSTATPSPVPSYVPTEAVPIFVSYYASSTVTFTPTPTYVPTEAVPSFVSFTTTPSATSCLCKSTVTFTVTLASPSAPPPASSVSSSVYASYTNTGINGNGSSPSDTPTQSASSGSTIITSASPTITEIAGDSASETGIDGVVTVITTLTTTMCPEASRVAAQAAAAAACIDQTTGYAVAK